MKIETKFNLGQKVAVLRDDKIIESTIFRIHPACIIGNGLLNATRYNQDQYSLLGHINIWFDEDKVFSDRKSLIASL